MSLTLGKAQQTFFSTPLPFRRQSPFSTTSLVARIRHRTMSTNSQSTCSLIRSSKSVSLAFHQRVARYSSRANNNNNNKLSRKERRLLERKERNQAKRERKISKTDESTTNSGIQTTISKFSWENFQNRFEFLIPRLPGRNISFTHNSLWMALGIRFPLFVAISYLITNEDTSPYVIQGSLGPSMLPTIQFVGDIWLVETRAWSKGWRWITEQLLGKQDPPKLQSVYQVGDLVIWEDNTSGKRSCKRIVGLEGDTVHRYGEYRNIYRDRDDAGVLWPKKKGLGDHVFGAFAKPDGAEESEKEETKEPSDILVVPKQCVWLEGDCPLFSMDSRQYGPIHSSHIRGRLVFRLWPWNRDDLRDDEDHLYLSSCSVSNQRPIPYSSIDAYVGNRFGLYRIEANSNE